MLYRLSYVGRLVKNLAGPIRQPCSQPAGRLERVMGIEPTQSAWKAEVLPLNYTRSAHQPVAKQSLRTARDPHRKQPACCRQAHHLLDVRDDPTPLRYSLVLVEGEGFEPSKA